MTAKKKKKRKTRQQGILLQTRVAPELADWARQAAALREIADLIERTAKEEKRGS
jgi:hypothetical protein